MAAKRKSKFSQTQIAQKAIMTSSAQRRFRAEGPDEEDIVNEIGASGKLGGEEFDKQHQDEEFERWLADQEDRQRRFLHGVPPELHAKAIRAYRRNEREERRTNIEEQLKYEKKVRDAQVHPVGDETEYDMLNRRSDYTDPEHAPITAARSALARLVKRQVGSRYLASGGTRQESRKGRPETLSLNQQLTASETEKRDWTLPTEEEAAANAAELLRRERIRLDKADAITANALNERRKHLLVLEADLKAATMQLPGRGEGIARPKPVPGQDVIPGLERPDINYHQSLESIRKERKVVEARLKQIEGMSEEGLTPEATEKVTRQELNQALSAIPDPLGRVKGERLSREERIAPVPLTPKGVEADKEAYVKAVVDSHHAATHRERVHAARRAERLAARILRRTETAFDRRKEEAGRINVLRKILPRDKVLITQQMVDDLKDKIKDEARLAALQAQVGYVVDRSTLSAGGQTLADLKARRRSHEGEKYIKPKGGVAGHYVKIPEEKKLENRPPTKPVHDTRLNDLTVEDTYNAYGHQVQHPRLTWEKQRLKAKFEGREDELPPAPAPFHSIKQQGKFMRSQAENRVKAVALGTDMLGWDEKGQPIALPGRTSRTALDTTPKARFGVAPNINYEYTLRNPRLGSEEADRTAQRYEEAAERLEYLQGEYEKARNKTLEWKDASGATVDVPDAVIEGKRISLEIQKRTVEKLKEEHDKLNAPVTKTIPITDQRTKFHEATRNRRGQVMPGEPDEVLSMREVPHQEDTMRFIQGARIPKAITERKPEDIDEIRYIATPGGTGQVRTVNDPTGAKKVVTEIQRVDGGQWERISRAEFDESLRERNRWELAGQGGNPPPRVKETPVPRKIQYKYMDPKDLELTAAARDVATIKIPGISLPGGRQRQEQVFYYQMGDEDQHRLHPDRFLRQAAETKRLAAAEKISREGGTQEELDKHGFRSRDEAKLVARAATAAGLYASKERFTKGHLPNVANKAIKLIPGSNKYEAAFNVHEAYVRPGVEKLAQVPFLISHPLSSATGDVMGIEVNTFRDRENWIDKQVLARRGLQRETRRLERVGRTAEFVQKHKADKGPLGAYTRWRLEPLSKHSSYMLNDQNGLLAKAGDLADSAHDANTYVSPRSGRIVSDLDPRAQAAVRELRDTHRHVTGLLRENPFEKPNMGPGFSRRSADFARRGIAHSGMERNVLIAGAAVGTAAGAAYLYHRHKQTKLPEEERVSFYNKVLPPVVETPKMFPHVRVTKAVKLGKSTLTNELNVAGKEIPVEFGVSLQSKRLAIRPVDRGYEPHSPIIGKVSLRGTPGGSKLAGLKYWGEEGPKRTAIKRSTHEVKIAGRQLPGRLKVSGLKPIKLSPTNPNRMTAEDRENIIWAHQGTDHEDRVKGFYRGMGGNSAKELMETWDNPNEVDRIMRDKNRAGPQYRQYVRSAVSEKRRTTVRSGRAWQGE